MAKKKAKKGAPAGTKLIASNKAARRNYAIDDTLEAGIVLLGSEVKSMREAQVQIADAYWDVTGPDLPAGTPVRIVGADGMTLKVEAAS